MQTAIRFDPERLPPRTRELREEVRDFLKSEADAGTFDPARAYKSRGFDRGFSRRVAAKGWIGLTWPKKYGGQERSFLDRYVVSEEFTAACAPVGCHFV
ncbi:MAG: acyl-CoA dehydrogenase family protein, partial [Pseudomonadota bacterium]|nr:acyl-CoA dehydrogenase family protein [Pseudomonadota bacterium]